VGTKPPGDEMAGKTSASSVWLSNRKPLMAATATPYRATRSARKASASLESGVRRF
jgi:hypothetical protein